MECVMSQKEKWTKRELEVLKGLIAGMGRQEIANELKISKYTIHHIFEGSFERHHIRSVLQLGIKAVLDGALPLDELAHIFRSRYRPDDDFGVVKISHENPLRETARGATAHVADLSG
jgi:hypothetical protein